MPLLTFSHTYNQLVILDSTSSRQKNCRFKKCRNRCLLPLKVIPYHDLSNCLAAVICAVCISKNQENFVYNHKAKTYSLLGFSAHADICEHVSLHTSMFPTEQMFFLHADTSAQATSSRTPWRCTSAVSGNVVGGTTTHQRLSSDTPTGRPLFMRLLSDRRTPTLLHSWKASLCSRAKHTQAKPPVCNPRLMKIQLHSYQLPSTTTTLH